MTRSPEFHQALKNLKGYTINLGFQLELERLDKQISDLKYWIKHGNWSDYSEALTRRKERLNAYEKERELILNLLKQ